MICLICRQAETVTGLISVHLVRGETDLTVNQVPAQICPNCGEGYLEETVANGLLQGTRAISLAGKIDNIYNYKDLLS